MQQAENEKQASSGLTIRQLQRGEGARVAALAAESATAAHWSASDYEAVAAGYRSQDVCLVAEHGPAGIVGLLHVCVAAGEADLLNIVVAAGERRHGVASALFDRAAEELRVRHARLLWLEVRESNTDAIAFYRAHGFQQRARRKTYYREPIEDALVFSLTLDSDEQDNTGVRRA